MQQATLPQVEQSPTASDLPGWQAPTFVEVKMDAEIGSYQTDFDYDDERR